MKKHFSIDEFVTTIEFRTGTTLQMAYAYMKFNS
jgi:hypothetical protein